MTDLLGQNCQRRECSRRRKARCTSAAALWSVACTRSMDTSSWRHSSNSRRSVPSVESSSGQLPFCQLDFVTDFNSACAEWPFAQFVVSYTTCVWVLYIGLKLPVHLSFLCFCPSHMFLGCLFVLAYVHASMHVPEQTHSVTGLQSISSL